jgi:SprT protein
MDKRVMQKAVEIKAKMIYDEAVIKFNIKNPVTLTHDFSIKGCAGGTAQYKRFYGIGVLRWNTVLMSENFEEYLETVIKHEVCHIICGQVYPQERGHGKYWKHVMIRMGISNPQRCHKMDITNISKNRKSTKVYNVFCRCGCEHKVTKLVYGRVLEYEKTRTGTSYSCRKCKSKLTIGGK